MALPGTSLGVKETEIKQSPDFSKTNKGDKSTDNYNKMCPNRKTQHFMETFVEGEL